MNRPAAEVLMDALALHDDQRLWVVRNLLASLDGETDADAESEWAAEIERRLTRIERGQAKSLTMDESLARLDSIARGG